MSRGTVLLQARMGSSRLPGKVLMRIGEKPMLRYTIECLMQSEAVERVVIATSSLKKDDPLEEFAENNGCSCYRGSEDNVLERFYEASNKFPAKYYFRATGDNPVVDPLNPVRSIEYLKEKSLDYCCESGMPVGTVVEAFTAEALHKCFELASEPDDLEHVTLLMKRDSRFRSEFFEAPAECLAPDLRMTVDYEEEFKKISGIIEELYNGGSFPEFRKIVEHVKNS